MTRRLAPIAAVVLAACAALAPAAWAISGTVVDPDRKPVVGGKVCYTAAGAEVLCSVTDESGHYDLPNSSLDRIRILADGFLPLKLAAVDHAAPIELKRAATLLVRLRDADGGGAIGEGQVLLLFPDGHKLGPAPVSAGGVRFRRQVPGTVIVQGVAQGYRAGEPIEVAMPAGKQTEVVVDLVADPVSPPAE